MSPSKLDARLQAATDGVRTGRLSPLEALLDPALLFADLATPGSTGRAFTRASLAGLLLVLDAYDLPFKSRDAVVEALYADLRVPDG